MYVYLDIWLIRAESRDQWLEDTRKLIDLVQSWVERSISKSELEPAQTLHFLGYHVDLIQGLVFPTAEKPGKFAQIAVSIRKSLFVTVRTFMSLQWGL